MSPAHKLRLLFAACGFAATALVASEGWELVAQPDPVHGNRIPTACAGVTENVKAGQRFTEQECVERTAIAMVKHAGPILKCVPDTMSMAHAEFLGTQVDTAYNIGVGRYTSSSMCRQMKAGNYRAVCDSILLYKYAAKRDCTVRSNNCYGVWIRRQEQRATCLRSLGLKP